MRAKRPSEVFVKSTRSTSAGVRAPTRQGVPAHSFPDFAISTHGQPDLETARAPASFLHVETATIPISVLTYGEKQRSPGRELASRPQQGAPMPAHWPFTGKRVSVGFKIPRSTPTWSGALSRSHSPSLELLIYS